MKDLNVIAYEKLQKWPFVMEQIRKILQNNLALPYKLTSNTIQATILFPWSTQIEFLPTKQGA